MIPEEELQQRLSRLQRISLFRDIAQDTAAMQQIAELFRTIKLRSGQTALREGEEGDELYIISHGTVEIVKKTSAGDPYTVVELSDDMNIFFGEVALLDPDRRSASVLCKTDCEFYVLEREQFERYGDANPTQGLLITRELSRILCRRLRKANGDIITLFDALVGEVGEAME
jgi:CRP-like cAMP-binding protein